MSRYDYQILRERAESGKQEDIDRLGRWFEEYGLLYWNGYYFDADGLRLFPVFEEVDGEFFPRGYEAR